MSGLKYTPERAHQSAKLAAEQNSIVSKVVSKVSDFFTCLITLAMMLVGLYFIGGYLLGLAYESLYEEDRTALLNSVCDTIYTYSYDDLNDCIIETKISGSMAVHTKYDYAGTLRIDVMEPKFFDFILGNVSYKKVMVTITFYEGKDIGDHDIEEEYAAIPNEDGSFTLEKFSDFRSRMIKSIFL